MATTHNEEKAQELLTLYNEYEEALYRGGKDYQSIPEHAWGDLEDQIEACGFELVQPASGLSTLRPK